METIVTLGIAGAFLFGARGSISVFLLLISKKVRGCDGALQGGAEGWVVQWSPVMSC
jgi:hypothetical protein